MSSNSYLDTVKAVLKGLLISSAQELTYHQLNRDYKACEGQDIPFSKLGYHNLQSFLLSLDDTLTLNSHTGVVTAVVAANSKNAHVHKLVKEQRAPKPPRTRRGKGNSNRPQTSTPQIWDTLPLYQHYPNIPVSQQSYNTMHNLPMNQMQFGQRWEPGNLLQRPNIDMMNMLYRQSLAMVPTQLTQNVFPTHTFTNTSTNKTIHRSNGPISSNGLSGSTGTSGSSRSNGQNERKNENVKSPNRMTSATDQRNGSKSPNRMVSTTDQQNGVGQMNGHSEETAENRVKDIAALPILDDNDPIHLIGTGCSSGKFGKSIPAAEYPIDLKSGDIHQINIKEVTSMWHFFFQFFDKQDHLNDMHAEISDSCVTSSLDMIVHPSQLQIGNVCAAFFCDKWMRAEVLGEPIDDLVKLLFVDFGTIANVSIQNCRWLLAQFCELPRFSHRGALAFLEPIDNYKIEKAITKTFCKMVRDKSMMGVILKIDECNTIFVTVIDTSQRQEDVIINKILSDSLLIARTANKR